MGDEVTKKDLQSLQGYCNKQTADLEKRVMAKIAEVEKNLIAQINKSLENINKNDAELLKGHTAQQTRLDEIIKVVNQHAQVIKELQSRGSG